MAKKLRFASAQVAGVFASYPRGVRTKLLVLRQLIFDVAAKTPGVGELEEALRWGQPSYSTTKSKSGSPIRLDRVKSEAGTYAMYFHCQTTLVDTFRELYRDEFRFGGNRSIVFGEKDDIPVRELRHCIELALTYHLAKRHTKRRRVPSAIRLRG